jgi:hypothetical protein
VAHKRLTLPSQQLSPSRERWATVFIPLVLMTGITAAIPSASCALARLKWRRSHDHRVDPGRLCPAESGRMTAPLER